jgi:hypothetical protein
LFGANLWATKFQPDAVTVIGKGIFPGLADFENKRPGAIIVNNGFLEEIKVQADQVNVVKIKDQIQSGSAGGTPADVVFECFQLVKAPRRLADVGFGRPTLAEGAELIAELRSTALASRLNIFCGRERWRTTANNC